MFWTNLFYNLAFSFLLGISLSEQGMESCPLAENECDCSCQPCVCQGNCPCPQCICMPCPGNPTACVCPNGGCPAACCPSGCPNQCGGAVGCPTACCPCCPTGVAAGQGCSVNAGGNGTVCFVPASVMPVVHTAPMQAAKQYTVQVHLTDGPRVVAPTSTTLVVTPNVPDSLERIGVDECQRQSSRVTATVREGCRGGVELDLGVAACSGKSCMQYHVKKTVPLNMATRVVLSGNGPEPCVAEVVVRPNPSMPMPVALPLPVPPYVPFAHGALPPFPPSLASPIRVAGMLPEPLPLPAPTVTSNEAFALCTCTPAPRRHSSHFSLVHEDGAARLKMHGDGMASTCTRMTVETPEAGKLRVAAGTKRIHVTGQDWKAQADRVEVRGDGHVVLTGHVRLTSEQIGVGAAVKAEAVTVKLRHGHFETCCRESK